MSIDAVDFSVFAAHDMLHVAKIARELGEAGKAAAWEQGAGKIAATIHRVLWNEADGFYYDAKLDDMWRGATWRNLNYFTILGLRRHGFSAEAARLKAETIEHVRKYYEQAGVVFEFYDAKDQLPPWHCDRKGPHRGVYVFRQKYDSIRDYHWTAAITACLLLE